MQAEKTPLVRAAEYVRMSTEMQCYSLDNQRAAIAQYAAERGFEITKTFADPGKSGLTLKHRDGLKSLLAEALAGHPDFEALLVYDVSRWGRFQDVDEGAHYEFLCRRAGIRVVYCAEPFENDGTPMSAVYKSLKRVMAGEYSRELSAKTSQAKNRSVAQGYFPGGLPGYGLRRLLVDRHGQPKCVMERGEAKNIRGDKTTYTWGPPDEVALVRRIFALYLDDGLTPNNIADLLNMEGHLSPRGRAWKHQGVRHILTRDTYAGNIVFGRRSVILGGPATLNSPSQWIRVEGAFPAIIEPERFAATQALIAARNTDEDLLRRLRELYEREGRLSLDLMRKARLPDNETYKRHFGSLFNAYKLVGYEFPPSRAAGMASQVYRREIMGPKVSAERARLPPKTALKRRPLQRQEIIADYHLSDAELLERLRTVWKREGTLSVRVIEGAADLPSTQVFRKRFGGLIETYRLVGFEMQGWFRRLLEDRARFSGVENDELDAAISARGKKPSSPWYSDEQLLAHLKAVLEKEGRLNSRVINRSGPGGSTKTYRRRFGSLFAAYRLIGFEPLGGPSDSKSPLSR